MIKKKERQEFKVSIKRVFDFKAPYRIVLENQEDWTHFIHLHRKSHAEFRLLFKRGNREIFLYKARLFFGFPFFSKTYIVFRDNMPEKACYRNVYLDVGTGQVHYLNGKVVSKGETTETEGEFIFSASPFWRFFPKLYFWLFQWRGSRLLEEDNWWMAERMAAAKTTYDDFCAPEVPELYDLFDDLYGEKDLPKGDIHFEETDFFDLEERARLIKAKHAKV